MQKPELKVLLIEDNPGDAFLIKFYLEESAGTQYQLQHVEELNAAFEELNKEQYDIVLVDLNLPDSFGVDTVKSLLDKYPDILVIVMTGLSDENVGIETVKLGAQDFLVKGRFDGKVLNSSIRYAFERFQLNVKLQKYTNEVKGLRQGMQRMAEKGGVAYFELHAKDLKLIGGGSVAALVNAATSVNSIDELANVTSAEFVQQLKDTLTSKSNLDTSTNTSSGKQIEVRSNYEANEGDEKLCTLISLA